MLTLRPYQSKVLDDLWTWFTANEEGNPIVEAAVGAGKSILIAELCHRALTTYPGTRVLMCVHVKELCEQNLQKLLTVWPMAPAGVHSASMGRKDLDRDILYATIGSVYTKAHLLGRVDLMLVDECHLISDSSQTMYRQLIDDLRLYNPGMRVIGWTGTAFRGDGIWLTQGSLFTHVAAKVTMAELLRDNYLAPLVLAPTTAQIDSDGVKTAGGDYVVSALASRADKPELVAEACAEIVRIGADRKKWLIFAVTVAHAQHITDELRQAHGVLCDLVTAKTSKRERERLLFNFKSGRLRALVNVAVLTTGFDAPEIDLIALLRPTRSPVLYVQIAGRGMRTAPTKTDCLWLDFTDTTATLGPVDAVKGRVRPPPKEGGGAPFKYCGECGNPSPVAAVVCVSCSHAFPLPEIRDAHGTQTGTAAVLSTAEGPVWHSVTRVGYSVHDGSRNDKPDSLRVDYWSGWRVVGSEWVCLEHTGYAQKKAAAWWERRMGMVIPTSVGEALLFCNQLLEPGRIAVQRNGKFNEVISYEFARAQNHNERAALAVADL